MFPFEMRFLSDKLIQSYSEIQKLLEVSRIEKRFSKRQKLLKMLPSTIYTSLPAQDFKLSQYMFSFMEKHF